MEGECLAHILALTRELKKLAHKSGFTRVALVLEMAELEAQDQQARLVEAALISER